VPKRVSTLSGIAIPGGTFVVIFICALAVVALNDNHAQPSVAMSARLASVVFFICVSLASDLFSGLACVGCSTSF
jgi:hypothetical protein